MQKTLQARLRMVGRGSYAALRRGLGWGLVGGLTGTLVMDLILMGALAVVGLPVLTCFSIVGSTVARFFGLPDLGIATTLALGAAAHYVIGPVLGAVFGAAAARVAALRVDTLKRGILLAVLYVEIVSQPILALAQILLKMTPAETLQWYGGSFGMHFILAVVLGAVVSRGLRPAAVVTQEVP